ncbi:MAG: DUF2793 domain-containing protein [Rhodobacteraceae bacterium]|nr:MAG: DUF2793 domain-containing protein [Paracoccaceae bacterium]
MPEFSARLSLPYIQAAQAQKHVTHNEAIERLDLVVQLVLQDIEVNTPPSLPQDGQIWATGGAPSGAWVGQPDRLAVWVNNGWLFITPDQGWQATLGSEIRIWDGNAWVSQPAAALTDVTGIGVNTGFDMINRLSVASEASLFSHDGAGHQLKINKQGGSDTASLLFQTGFSGRAEIGTAGNEDFTVKVSPDGGTWYDALQVAGTSGAVSMPNGVEIAGSVTGTAITQAPDDSTPGRLLKVGDFGLGRAESDFSASANLDVDFRNAVSFGLQTVTDATGGYPAGFASNASALAVLRAASDNRGVQVLHGLGAAASGSDAGLAMRAFRNDGTDGAWQVFYNTHNVLGTVAQTGGVPTGALIENGSNSNGHYVRFADGTQICTRSVTHDLDDLEAQAWAFPASFASTPVASFAVIGTSAAALEAWGQNGGTAWAEAVEWRTRHRSALSNTIEVQLTATGRWF